MSFRRACFGCYVLVLPFGLLACASDEVGSATDSVVSDGGSDGSLDLDGGSAGDGASDSGSAIDAGDAGATVETGPASTARAIDVSPLALSPPFSPSIHDYVVRCSAGTNDLTVALTAGAGEAFGLVAPTTTDAQTKQSNQLSVTEDQAIVARVATASGENEDYWIRCLPHDFPTVTVTSHPDVGVPTPGWYLLGDTFFGTGDTGFAMIVDGNGTPVWYRRTADRSGALNLELLAADTLSFAPNLGGAAGFGIEPNGRYELHDLDTGATRYVKAVGSDTDHHELQLLPNGDALILTYPIVQGIDLTGLGTFGANQAVADCEIQELDPAGDLVWSWRAGEHLDPVRESVAPPTAVVNGQTVVDLYHCNSIDVAPGGDLLLSSRHTNAVYFIDRETGKVKWKLGGTAYNLDGAALVAVTGDPEGGFNRQHDARFRPNGDVTLFDDQSLSMAPARGVEYAIDLASKTASVVWQYQGAASVGAMGSFRRYDDGSSVIGWGTGTPVFTEVDAKGRPLYELAFDPGADSYRAIKVPIGALDIALLRATAAGSN